MKIFFITGKPACGKDTQADFLAKRFRARKVVTSNVLKRFLQQTKRRTIMIGGSRFNSLQQQANLRAGRLVAYRLVAHIVSAMLERAIRSKQSLVIAGSPRSVVEARAYLDLFRHYRMVTSAVFIHLNISNREALTRALNRKQTAQRRSDNLDQLSVIKKRLKVFRQEVLPGIVYLKRQRALIEVSGEGSQRQVSQRILKAIK